MVGKVINPSTKQKPCWYRKVPPSRKRCGRAELVGTVSEIIVSLKGSIRNLKTSVHTLSGFFSVVAEVRVVEFWSCNFLSLFLFSLWCWKSFLLIVEVRVKRLVSGKRRNNSPIHGSVHRVSCTSCRGADGRGMMMDDVLPFFEGGARDLVILGTFCFIQQAVKNIRLSLNTCKTSFVVCPCYRRNNTWKQNVAKLCSTVVSCFFFSDAHCFSKWWKLLPWWVLCVVSAVSFRRVACWHGDLKLWTYDLILDMKGDI